MSDIAESSASCDYIFPKMKKEMTELTLHGRTYLVKKVTRDGTHLIIEDEESGQPVRLGPREFWSLFEEDKLVINDDAFENLPDRFQDALDRSVEPSLEKDKWAAFRRFKYCVAVDNAPDVSKTEKGLQPIIDRVAKDIGDLDPPDHTSVARWARERGVPGKRLARYMRDHHDRKGRSDWLDPDQDAIVESNIEIFWKNERALRPKEIIEAVYGEIALRNVALRKSFEISDEAYKNMTKTERKELGFIIEPADTTIRRRIARHDGYETTKARHRKRVADEQYRGARAAPKATRVNEVWYIDHTLIDGHLVYSKKTKMPLGRPWLTVVIDGFSRNIVGFFISYAPPSIHSVALALKNAIAAKTYVASEFPQISRPWIAMGLPSRIVCDRALEFTGRSFELACASLGIEVVWCPRKTPRWKGIVERLFRTINTDFIELLPGATKGDARKLTKEDRNPVAEAEISHSELNFLFHKWSIEVYPRKTHKGIIGRPGEIYESGIRQNHPSMPRRAGDLSVLGMKFKRTLTSAGVHFQYLRFSHGQRVFDVLDGVGKTKIKVIITVDPSNLNSVIIDAPGGQRVQLPCLDPELIEGLSLWEHRNLVKYMRCCNYDLADRERWLIAKKEIRDTLMASLLNRKNKVSTNSTIARRLNIGGKGNVGLVALNRVVDTEADWLKLDFVDAEDTDPDALYKDSHEGRLQDSDADGLQPIVDEPTKTMNEFGRRPPKLPRKKKVATPTDDIARHDTPSMSQAEQPDDDIDDLLSKYSAPRLSRT